MTGTLISNGSLTFILMSRRVCSGASELFGLTCGQQIYSKNLTDVASIEIIGRGRLCCM